MSDYVDKKRKEARHRYYITHRESALAYQSDYDASHKEQRRAYMREYMKKYRSSGAIRKKIPKDEEQ